MVEFCVSHVWFKSQLSKLGEMGKSDKVKLIDPIGLECNEGHCLQWFMQAGWYRFTCKFNGLDYQVARAFAKTFDG